MDRQHGQRFVTHRNAKDKTIGWQLWYDQFRLHAILNDLSPMQFDKHWFAAQA